MVWFVFFFSWVGGGVFLPSTFTWIYFWGLLDGLAAADRRQVQRDSVKTAKVKRGDVCCAAGAPADKTQHVHLLTGPEAPLLPRDEVQNNLLGGVKQI